MSTTLNPYLNFRGDAGDALAFYHSVFGGELTSSTFADFQMAQDPADADKIMHGQLTTPSGFTLMASDTPSYMEYAAGTNSFSISLSGAAADADELTGYFDALSEGGTIGQPLTAAPWGDTFGMLTDRFGISWLVNILSAQPEA